MLLLMLMLATHVPQSNYLTCEDYEWLKRGVNESSLFTTSEKVMLIFKWMEHTDPVCFTLDS